MCRNNCCVWSLRFKPKRFIVCLSNRCSLIPFFSNQNDAMRYFLAVIVSTTLVSVYSVLLVSIDRFFYISHGLRYQQYIFPNRVRILIVISWIIGNFLFKLKIFQQFANQNLSFLNLCRHVRWVFSIVSILKRHNES